MSDLVGKTIAEALWWQNYWRTETLSEAEAARIHITSASYSAKRRKWQLGLLGPQGASTVHISQGLVRKEATHG